MHDLLVKGGTIVDGSGSPAFVGDVAIDAGRVTAVGAVEGEGRTVIDARGKLVTPGFVDVHTHFDGQVTWDPLLTPTCWHGVTTVVMGNCGVGFAPAAPERREWLIGLMEGVEDIPGTALSAGIQWNWESFPQYLDYLDRIPLAIDVGTQVPHGAVRAYVMGERGAANEDANPEDIDEMARIVREGIEAGALGFSTSRTIAHRAIDGRPVPGTFAAEAELMGIGRALGDLGRGIYELAPAGVTGDDLSLPEKEIAWMHRLSAGVGRPVTFALVQYKQDPEAWRRVFDLSERAARDGAQLFPQVHGRSVGGLITLETYHPFQGTPTFRSLDGLSHKAKVDKLSQKAVRQAVIAEAESHGLGPLFAMLGFEKMFPLADPPDYEPDSEQSVAAIARRERRSEFAVIYDLLLERDGRQVILAPIFNYAHDSLDAVAEMLEHPQAALGLADGGAHCGFICDASVPTFMLTHWVRDRSRGKRLPLEWAVKRMTSDTANLYGLHDRGLLKPGMKGDLNVIDFDNLGIGQPELVHDLPAGGRRWIQRARGYIATVNSGEVVMRDGRETGARPGKLLRGERPAPTPA